MPEVAVIIPTHNRAHCISRAIQSALNQTRSDLEIIISDDGSNDGTEEVVSRFHDLRIKYIRSGKSEGAGAARNRAIEASDSLYTAFLDSDDEWLPDKLERQLTILSRLSREWAAIYSGAYVHKVNRGRTVVSRPTKQGDLLRDLVLGQAPIWTPTLVVRRAVLDEVGLFDVRMLRHQDLDLFWRIAASFKIAVVPDPLATVHIETNKRLGYKAAEAKELLLNKHDPVIRRLLTHSECRTVWGRQWLNASIYLARDGHYLEAVKYLARLPKTKVLHPPRDYLRLALSLVTGLGVRSSRHQTGN